VALVVSVSVGGAVVTVGLAVGPGVGSAIVAEGGILCCVGDGSVVGSSVAIGVTALAQLESSTTPSRAIEMVMETNLEFIGRLSGRLYWLS